MSSTIDFLVFSDIHFHAFSKYSEDTSHYLSSNGKFVEGVNTRLIDCLSVFCNVVKYAKDRNIDTILFCGDLLHSKLHITKDVINVVFRAFQYAKERDIRIVLIPGNHDYIDKKGTNHSLLALESFDNVVCSKGWFTIYSRANQYSLTINSVPYTEDKQELINNINSLGPTSVGFPKFLLAHCGIQGSKVGSDYIMIKDHDIDLGEVNLNHYDACFFGHYHEHQRIAGNAWIVGATHEHVWSDMNGKRGFIHVTLEENINSRWRTNVKHIEVDRTIPRFKLVDGLDDIIKKDLRPWDFIRFQSKEELTEDAKDGILGYITMALGKLPKYLEILPPKVDDTIKEDFVLSEKATSAETVLTEWVNHSKPELDLDKVLLIGKELLAEAKNKML